MINDQMYPKSTQSIRLHSVADLLTRQNELNKSANIKCILTSLFNEQMYPI